MSEKKIRVTLYFNPVDGFVYLGNFIWKTKVVEMSEEEFERIKRIQKEWLDLQKKLRRLIEE